MASHQFWTEARIQQLKELCSDATLSAADIAARVGCTRSAALGKIHRLGLSVKAKQVDPEQVMRAKAARLARNNAAQRARYAHCSKSTETREAPKEAPPFVGSLNLPFGDLRMFSPVDANQCRYIHGDSPDYLCCGTETLLGVSYCGHHVLVVRGRSINVSDDVRAAAAARMRKRDNRMFGSNAVKIPLTHRIPDDLSLNGAL